MNVLLIGDDSMIVDAMIDKFNKDNHRIYWLTGRKEKGISRKHVFEKYQFLYTDGNMKDIIESAAPDVILFMGAYDTNFDWRYNGQAEALRYTTSMVNLLSAYSMYGRGRLSIFLRRKCMTVLLRMIFQRQQRYLRGDLRRRPYLREKVFVSITERYRGRIRLFCALIIFIIFPAKDRRLEAPVLRCVWRP